MQKLPTQKDKNQEDKDHELMHAYKACINFFTIFRIGPNVLISHLQILLLKPFSDYYHPERK